ncbi:Nup133 N terminal like-domain-containing protein [Dipodascopsis uninucleata]
MQSNLTGQRRSARLQARRSRQVSSSFRLQQDQTLNGGISSADMNQDSGQVVRYQSSSENIAGRHQDSAVEFTKNSKYCVLKLPALPSILRSREGNIKLNGYLNASTSAALILTQTTAYVWQYISPDHLPPTISFPISNTSGLLPLGVLVSPSAGSTEPGLVLLNRDTGQIVYWEAVGGAIAEGLLHHKKGVEAIISLYQGETLDYLQNIEPVGVMSATSSGRFILVSLHDAAGRPAIQCTVMRGNGTGIWSNLKGVLKLASTRRDVTAIKVGKTFGRGERMVVTVNVRGAVTRWHCSRTGHYNLLFEMDLREQLINSISEVYPQAESTFQVHDIEMLPDDERTCVILASFVYDEQESKEQIFYVLFTVSVDQNDFKIDSVHRITCYSRISTRSPRLFLPRPGFTAFIVLSHAVIMVDTVLKHRREGLTGPSFFRWEDVVEFKSTVNIVASGTEDLIHVNDQVSRHAGIVVIARGSGVIRIERFEDELAMRSMKSSVDVIKSKLEQAVYYGFIDETPLKFEHEREVGYDVVDIEKALGNFSDEIISGQSIYSTQVPDVTESLLLRCQALGRLAEHLSAIFPSLTVDCRLKLLWKLEKSEASKNMWNLWQSDRLDNDTLLEVLEECTGKKVGVDEWFHGDVSGIQELVTVYAGKTLIRAKAASSNRALMRACVKNINSLVIMMLDSSAYFIRNYYMETVFHLPLTANSSSAPWTSTWEILSLLSKQFDITRAICTESWQQKSNDNQIELEVKELLNQLVALAECLCRAFVERISYCNTNDLLSEQAENIKVQYFDQRGTWIKPLLDFGFTEKAFQLAEYYKDFKTLAEMCHEEKIQLERLLDDAERASAMEKLSSRIKNYFDVYEYEFAEALYQYYIDSGLMNLLFIDFPSYQHYLERFLSEKSYDRIGWIHDLQIGRVKEAGETLIKVADTMDDSIQNKRLQLSIAKLCMVSATMHGADARTQIDMINEQLSSLYDMEQEQDEKNAIEQH